MATTKMDSRLRWMPETLTGWGRNRHSECEVAEPTTLEDALLALRVDADASLLARGAGRSYGDAALNAGGRIIRTTRMTAVEEFDPQSGRIVVEPGVTFGQLVREFAPRGWIPPVTPGTQFATIGGAIANDVHGKNHDADGSFCDHLLWFDLATAGGSLQRVDTATASDLFAATIGGIGLTGAITRACFQMKRIPGPMLLVRERRIRDLDEYLDALAEARTRHRYSVGWIDGIATGRQLGRGILEVADPIDDQILVVARRSIRMPFDLPSGIINSLTVALFNRLYYRRVPASGRERKLDLERFFYPLDSIIDWNRIYGRQGFVQFQCAIPDPEARRGIRRLLEMITASGRSSFLAVIKTLGRPGRGFLSFPLHGVTLALDFPYTADVPALLASLHEVTMEHGGRIYLAKDSCLTPAQFRHMYPQVPALQAVLNRIDSQRRMRSDMSLRLQL
jgi:decaprenylphospho-beta-D-ribofuranose 2-oxidase